ncbi:MAG: hypothetical protein PVI40_05725 [Chlamydiota bacterium]|jgi:tetratricopeptide (TPR) repeat protein
MAIKLEKSDSFDFNVFQQNLHQHYRKLLHSFKKILRSYVKFNLFFSFLFVIEIITFFICLTSTIYLAFSLGSLFLTTFSYFVILFYFQAKKPEQIQQIKNQFIDSCKQLVTAPKGHPDHHLSIAHAALRLVSYLHGFEWNLYHPPKLLHATLPFFEKMSVYFHWKDVHKMKEMLLQSAIEEHINQIRFTPTNLEVHTSLANSYVSLSKLYLNPQKYPHQYLLQRQVQKLIPIFQEKFKIASTRAIEEFKIINNYAPDDPWVHLQLAKSYSDLQMPENEVSEYETVLKLKPDDKDILFRLGVLYFEQGLNAKGLKVYESLKKANYQKAESLIRFFGCFNDQTLFEDTF